jgi:hypothetical protein
MLSETYLATLRFATGELNLNSAVAGLKMAHLLEITLGFLICGAHPEGARV